MGYSITWVKLEPKIPILYLNGDSRASMLDPSSTPIPRE